MTDQKTASDRELAEELRSHHELMVGQLDTLTSALLAPTRDAAAKEALIEWIHNVLLPHAAEEEETTYAAAGGLLEGAALVDAMMREHGTIKRLAAAFHEAAELPLAAAYARSLFFVFEGHQAKENEIVIPMLLASPGVSLAEVMSSPSSGVSHHHHH